LVPPLSLAQVQKPEDTPLPEIPTNLFGCSPNEELRRCLLRVTAVILRVIMIIALILAAIMIAWAGIEYITKAGKVGEKEVEPKNRIIYAAVGLVIAFMAWAAAAIISNVLTGTGAPRI
jgi:TRAP-type C4-dicarboxylate transport system permease small subunit